MTAAPPETLTERDTEDGRGRHRHRRPRRTVRRKVLAAAAGAVGLAALGAGYVVVGGHGGTPAADEAKHAAVPHAAQVAPAGRTGSAPATGQLPTAIPGIGPKTRAAIPAATRQVLVASGKAKDSSVTVVTLWSRTDDGHWRAGASWPAHNALHGWTRSHHAGDLHSPIGVFGLTDAGGFEADPGSKLPYHRSSRFRAGGVGFDG